MDAGEPAGTVRSTDEAVNIATAKNDAAPWIEKAARVGFATKGFVYIIIGVVSILAALGNSSQAIGPSAALGVVAEKPFGRTLLYLAAIGLFGYMIWRLIDAIQDASGRGSDSKGLAVRAATAFKGLVYAGLGIEAFRLARGGGRSGGGKTQHWMGELLDLPFGKILAVLVGLGLIGYAIYQLSRAWRAKLGHDLSVQSIPAEVRTRVVTISRIGIAARAIVFLIIGYFATRAAFRSDPGQAKDVGSALGEVGSFGATVLILISLGMIAYGIYELVNAKYRRIRT